MKRLRIILFMGLCCALYAGRCCAQEVGDFQPSSTNVWGANYPRVDNAGRVQVRVKAPNAMQVKLNLWSGPESVRLFLHIHLRPVRTNHAKETEH